MDGGKEWLEIILKKKALEDAPVKVIEVLNADSGIGKGENYLSLINRLKAKVLLGLGQVKTMSFILKNQHETERLKKFSVESGVFFREITMYRDIFPKMQSLLEEIGDSEEVFWPKCYDIRLYNRLMLEDLRVSGYRMANRKKQLGLDASLLVIKQLAKFHALSRILIQRGEIPTDIFKRYPFIRNEEEFVKNTNTHVVNLIRAMENWGEEWKEAIERFKKAEDFGQRAFNAYNVDPDEFAVLCHGDCWTNNLLFDGEDLEHPKSVKFLDLQMSYVFSPVRDLAYFFQTSSRPELKDRHFDLFLQVYCNTLETTLLKFSYEGFIPDVHFVQKKMNQDGLLQLLDAIRYIPVVMMEENQVPDFEDIFQKIKEAEEKGENKRAEFYNLMNNMNDKTVMLLQAQIKKALASGLI